MAENSKKQDADVDAPISRLDVSIDEALARAEAAASELKPREAALYWTLIGQTQLPRDLHDALHAGTGEVSGGHIVEARRRRWKPRFRLWTKGIGQTPVPI